MSFGYTVNKEKNGVLLAYLAERIPNVTLRKLLKLVYLTDEKFTIERGFPLTWFNYFAWKKGPVAPEVYDVKNGSFADFVQCHRNSNDKYEVSPVGGALTEDRLNLYSRYEMNMIDEIISKYGSMSADELTDITHLENTLWSKVVNENKLTFSDSGRSDCEIHLNRLIEGDEEKEEVFEDALEYMQFCNATSTC
jgi:uncharacterized phage-associated protein